MIDETPDNDDELSHEQSSAMEMPLFPLNVVLFPGMALPLHIFEPRYREMINRCLDENLAFGVVLIKEGPEVGGDALPRRVGTAARIVKVDRQPDGRMNIQVVGTRRFRIEALKHDRPYLSGRVRHFPVTDGDTKLATERAHQVRPKIMRYVELLTKATGVQLKLDRLPEDATSLAFPNRHHLAGAPRRQAAPACAARRAATPEIGQLLPGPRAPVA